jgi:hypothetical protein
VLSQDNPEEEGMEDSLQLDLELELEAEEPQLDMEEAQVEGDNEEAYHEDNNGDQHQGFAEEEEDKHRHGGYAEDDHYRQGNEDDGHSDAASSLSQYGFADFDDVLLSKSSLLESLQSHSQPADESVSLLARAAHELPSRESDSDREDRSEQSYSSDDDDYHEEEDDDETTEAKQLIREFWQQVRHALYNSRTAWLLC